MNMNTEFLPFHAINEYMRPDFRLKVVRDTLESSSSLPDEIRISLYKLIKKYVKIPGFRNSEKAPPMIQVLPLAKSFEKTPELVKGVLAAWAEVHKDLREQVYNVLKSRSWRILPPAQDLSLTQDFLSSDAFKDWPILPIDIDRTKLPGFYAYWPKGEDFEAIYNTFAELYPDAKASIDQVSLMAVWLSLRLPYHIEETSVSEPSTSEEPESIPSQDNQLIP